MFNPWINQEFLKGVTPISTNIDIKEVAPHIETTQLIFTREIFGKLLYDSLDAEYVAGTFSSTFNENVFNINKYAIAYRAAEQALPFLNNKIRNKGVVRMNDEFGVQSNLDEVKYLRHELKNRAEYYENEVKTYLCEYNNEFPLYLSSVGPNGEKQLIYPQTDSSYDSDIYVDDFNYKKGRYYYGPNSNEPGNKY